VKHLRDPLLWLIAVFVALLLAMPYSGALFGSLFPQLPRPVYQQESFVAWRSPISGWWACRVCWRSSLGWGRELQ
jgi:hypothetical protein